MNRESIPDLNNIFRSAAHWRKRAEEMRTIAEEARDSTVRAMMLRIAADYDRLAEHADDETARDTLMFGGAADCDRFVEHLEDKPDSHLAG